MGIIPEPPIDLDAIRQRNKERKGIASRTAADEDAAREAGMRDDDFDREFFARHTEGDSGEIVRNEFACDADIDTLLAEVERLRLTMTAGFQCPECGWRFNDRQGLSLHAANGCPNLSVQRTV